MSLEALEALRTRFRERAIGERSMIEAWAADGYPASEEVERVIHNLSGAAGTFGFASLHTAAARIDDAFSTGAPADPQDVDALLEELGALGPR